MKKTAVILAAVLIALSASSCGERNAPVSSEIPAAVKAVQPEGWVSNEYTDILPIIPDGLDVKGSKELETGNGYSVMLGNADLDMPKAYIASLKNSGFTQNTSEGVYDQIDMCMFTASNAEGYTVEIIYSVGTLAVNVRK